jgi:hypothetical protein
MSDFVAEAVADRIKGGKPSRWRAFFVAILIAAAAGVLAYRLLRGTPGPDYGD